MKNLNIKIDFVKDGSETTAEVTLTVPYHATELEVVDILKKEHEYLTKEDKCQTAHYGRCEPHFDFGRNTSPIVPYRYLTQIISGITADCRSLV